VRDAAGRSLREIHDEIRGAQAARADLDLRRGQIRRMRRVPRPVRALLHRALARSPRAWKRYGGTVVLTSIGMFGKGAGWGISAPGYPLSVIVGGIGERPALAEGRLEAREVLSLTVSFDHTLVDGADAARFVARLKELVESCHGLRGPEPRA
jgi:hypothetical protein